MGIFSRVVKPADEAVWDQESRRKMHGSDPKWQSAVARGNLRRMNEKPKPAPWSKDKRKP